jgi:hypothetical protein
MSKVEVKTVKSQSTKTAGEQKMSTKSTKTTPKSTKTTNLGVDLAKKVQSEVEKQPSPEVLAAIKLLEAEGYKVTKKKQGSGSRARLSVKANGVVYSKLTEALRANGFNVQSDWVAVRKLLKDADGAEVTYESTTFQMV